MDSLGFGTQEGKIVKKRVGFSIVLLALILAAPARARQTQTQNATSGPLTVEIMVPTEDYVGQASSFVFLTVTITSFSSNDPAQLWWGAWENDPLFDDAMGEETIDPSMSDAEYDGSTDTWSKTASIFPCDISFYEPAEAEAEVYAYAQMFSPDVTVQTANLIVNLIADTTPPDTTITSPAAGTYGSDITFQFTGSDDNTASADLFFAWKLDPLEASYSTWEVTNSKDYTSLAAGNYTFYVKSMDLGANEDATPATVAITVETVSVPNAPTGPSSGVVGVELTFNTSGAISSEGHVVEHRFDFGDSTITGWSSSTSVSHTYSSAGSLQVKAQARCPAHSVESPWSSSLTVTISTPPSNGGDGGCGAGASLASLLVFACLRRPRKKEL